MPKWSNDAPKREKYINRKAIWNRDAGICQMCLRQCVYDGRKADGFVIDHLVPVYSGGAGLGSSNLRTLCKDCHRRVSSTQAGERAAENRQVRSIREKPKRQWAKQKLQSRPFPKKKGNALIAD